MGGEERKGRGWRKGKRREGRGHSLIFNWIDATASRYTENFNKLKTAA